MSSSASCFEKIRVSTAAGGEWYAAGASRSMYTFAFGRRKVASVLCHSRSHSSSRSSRGNTAGDGGGGALSAAALSAAAEAASHARPNSVGMNGLGCGSARAASICAAAPRHAASSSALGGSHAKAVPYHSSRQSAFAVCRSETWTTDARSGVRRARRREIAGASNARKRYGAQSTSAGG